MLHEKFDLDRFNKLFPLASLRQQARQTVLENQKKDPARYPDKASLESGIEILMPGGEKITSPYDVSVVEQLRAEASAEFADIERVPTDVFVFAKGEPTDRRVTKIGGLPYWPKSDPWPTTGDDEPMRFVAQINFSDSRFIFPKLPGDLLVIFSPQVDVMWEGLECHWVRTRESRLVAPKDVPDFKRLMPVYGVLHRTYDYFRVPESLDGLSQPWLLGQIEGTKIGGLPRWIQNEEEIPGDFLCALGSIQPVSDRPFPWVNIEAPEPFLGSDWKRQLMWGDMGSVYFFVDSDGEVRHTIQCY